MTLRQYIGEQFPYLISEVPRATFRRSGFDEETVCESESFSIHSKKVDYDEVIDAVTYYLSECGLFFNLVQGGVKSLPIGDTRQIKATRCLLNQRLLSHNVRHSGIITLGAVMVYDPPDEQGRFEKATSRVIVTEHTDHITVVKLPYIKRRIKKQ